LLIARAILGAITIGASLSAFHLCPARRSHLSPPFLFLGPNQICEEFITEEEKSSEPELDVVGKNIRRSLGFNHAQSSSPLMSVIDINVESFFPSSEQFAAHQTARMRWAIWMQSMFIDIAQGAINDC
jgi:hypothetical protein